LYCSELFVALLSKNFTKRISFLCQKALPMSLPAEVRTLNFVLSHSPYCPSLVPTDFQLSGPLNDVHRGRRFSETTSCNKACMKICIALTKSFKQSVYSITRKVGRSVLIMKENLWKNNLSFVKYVTLVYAYFIKTLSIDKLTLTRRQYN